MQRCVHKVVEPTGSGNYRNENGLSLEVSRYSLFSGKVHDLHSFGCSVAIQLFMSFNWNMALCFVCMFIGPRQSDSTLSPLPPPAPPLDLVPACRLHARLTRRLTASTAGENTLSLNATTAVLIPPHRARA